MPWIGPVVGGVLGLISSQQNSGGSTQQQVPSQLQPLLGAIGQRGMELGNLPYQPYQYSQVADFNPYQFAGMDMATQTALSNPIPGQAGSTLGNTLSGAYVGNPGQNPYMGQTNPYSGSNPYLQSMIDIASGDITRQYNTNVAPSTAATALKSGSFGNTGFGDVEAQNRDALLRALGNTESGMRMQDYGMQQQLAESGLNRNANLGEANLNRQQQAYENERQRMTQALSLAPSIYSMAFQPAETMMGLGGTMQQQGQNVLNSYYNQFQQAQQWPFQTYEAMLSPFKVNTGGTTTSTLPSNPVAGLLGGAMMGQQVWPGTSSSTAYNPWTDPNSTFMNNPVG